MGPGVVSAHDSGVPRVRLKPQKGKEGPGGRGLELPEQTLVSRLCGSGAPW